MSKDKLHNVPTSYTTITNIDQSKRVADITERLEKLMIIAPEDFKSVGPNAYALLSLYSDSIQSFNHPIITKDGKVFMDARPFLNRAGGIKNKADYMLLERRSNIELAWANDPFEFVGHEAFIGDIFGSWVANVMGSRLNLPLVDAMHLRILATIYYVALIQRDTSMNEEETIPFLVRYISKITRIPAQPIDDFFTGNESHIHRLFLEAAGANTTPIKALLIAIESTMDEDLGIDQTTIYNSLTRGAFVASNAADIVAVALEVPPVFFLIVGYSLQKGIFGKTTIGQTALGLARKHDSRSLEAFIKQAQSGELLE